MKFTVEDTVQIDIFNMFELRKKPFCICFHVPNGGYRAKQEAEKFKLMGVVPGVPDLVFLRFDGRVFFGEVKTKSKSSRRSDDQDIFHQRIRQANATVSTWRSIEEAEQDLVAWGLIE